MHAKISTKFVFLRFIKGPNPSFKQKFFGCLIVGLKNGMSFTHDGVTTTATLNSALVGSNGFDLFLKENFFRWLYMSKYLKSGDINYNVILVRL